VLLLLFKLLAQLGNSTCAKKCPLIYSSSKQQNDPRHVLLPEVAVVEYSHLGLPLTSPTAKKFGDRFISFSSSTRQQHDSPWDW